MTTQQAYQPKPGYGLSYPYDGGSSQSGDGKDWVRCWWAHVRYIERDEAVTLVG